MVRFLLTADNGMPGVLTAMFMLVTERRNALFLINEVPRVFLWLQFLGVVKVHVFLWNPSYSHIQPRDVIDCF